MKTYGEKVRAAREKAGLSQVELAEKIGYAGKRVMVGQKLISTIENGKGPRGPSMPTRKLIGEALAIDVEGNPPRRVELSAHFGEGDEAGVRIPVFACVAAGEMNLAFTDQGYAVGDGMYTVLAPRDIKIDYALALEVRGPSMSPKYEQGQVVIADTTKEPGNGDLAIVGLRDGMRYIKKWMRKAGKITLESFNPEYGPIEVPAKAIQFKYKIIWARER